MVTSKPEVELDSKLLEETALAIYRDLTRSRMRGFDPSVVAQKAFVEAKAFVIEAMAIRNGKLIPDVKPDDEPLFVRVHLWDGSKGLHGEPRMDDNGKPVYEIQPVDPYAFAPNIPPHNDGSLHPINQRYLPNAIRNKALVASDGSPLPPDKLAALTASLN